MSKLWKLGTGSIVEIRGKDRSKVFNNLATQDLRELAVGQSRETFITDSKGRTFGHGLAIGLPEFHLFVSVPGQAERLVPHFDRFIIMEDATITDRSSAFTLWLAADESILPRLGIDLPAAPWPDSFTTFWNGLPAHLVRAPWAGPTSRLLLSESPELPTSCDPSLHAELLLSDLDHRSDWEALRIQSFWPWYGIDLDDKNFPQELDRDTSAISFRKGCYLGQETVARLDALGQVQKKLVKLAISGDGSIDMNVPEETKLRSGDSEVGQLRSYAPLSPGAAVGLGYVKRSHFTPGTELRLGTQGHTAVVMPRE
ncbi:putative dimethyl sulfoniopropionate demethylase [Pirellula sp. SH-Sr6A]|uniref:CAF17-like 4Fe-4S cluster assembly/insertion protein YgfZ n=1 Tax=Pirellula sp. SH-Sr6A TaxID=1632865 RepID=UPI00078BE8D6|nr:hypothetical protein [Pirellula sp. SH-Sr6A]AMV30589.1 putative dimethyl sulfoniopropionate demethylase [Pirellula sp. SH-Sr6A]